MNDQRLINILIEEYSKISKELARSNAECDHIRQQSNASFIANEAIRDRCWEVEKRLLAALRGESTEVYKDGT